MCSAAMQELIVTARASFPMKAANSASKALHCGPWVRIGPCRTSRTDFRSSSVIHGRPNGIVRGSLIDERLSSFRSSKVKRNFSTFGHRAVGGKAGAHQIELALGAGPARPTVLDCLEEAREKRSFGSRLGRRFRPLRQPARVALTEEPR